MFGLSEDATLSSHRQQNKTDCKFFNKKLLVLCPAKCSYSVRLGKHMLGKIRPIKLMFKTLVEQDSACFFLMSESTSIKAAFPLFSLSWLYYHWTDGKKEVQCPETGAEIKIGHWQS